MKIDPIQDCVLVLRDEPEKMSKGGILLAREAATVTGTVLAVGPGKPLREGGPIVPVEVAVGDRVFFDKYMGTEVLSEGRKVLVLRAQHLLMVIPPEATIEIPAPPTPPVPDHLQSPAGGDYDFS